MLMVLGSGWVSRMLMVMKVLVVVCGVGCVLGGIEYRNCIDIGLILKDY